MKIIDKVKIGGFVYDVKRPESAFVGKGGTALDGEHSYAEKTITVGGNGCEEYQNLVFLHEICHAIIEAYVSPDEHNERFVEAFSKGLYQVVVDNPDLFLSTDKHDVTDIFVGDKAELLGGDADED